MAVQTRTTALQGEYVRLYCRFIQDGILVDPFIAPQVYITDNRSYQESSSSVSESSSLSNSMSSSSAPFCKLIATVYDEDGNAMGTYTSDKNCNTGSNIVFSFTGATFANQFPYVIVFTSNLPSVACDNISIESSWETSMGIIWNDSCEWSAIDGYYVLLNSNLAVQLLSITINVCKESSSSISSESSNTTDTSLDYSYGPFTAEKEHTGLWYVDWLVPEDLTIGRWFDIWKFKWNMDGDTKTETYEITVNKADQLINSIAPAKAYNVGDMVFGMMNDLSNNFIYEAMHIPIYWEQGYITGDKKTYNFAYANWNHDPKPIVRINQRIRLDGWEPNYNGNIHFKKRLDLEDMVYAQYNFKYFSQEEIMDFLNMGLYALNSTAPASLTYSGLNNAPFAWRFGILLYAAIKAIQRLVFGLNFQERALIFAEKPENVQAAITNLKSLYADYNTLWLEIKKDVKTLRLPTIGQISIPEYTLPGGRCLSSTTYISFTIENKTHKDTIENIFKLFEMGKEIYVLSMLNEKIIYSKVSKIWDSGIKQTYILKTKNNELKASAEHLIYLPKENIYKPIQEIIKGNYVCEMVDGQLKDAVLLANPIPNKEEKVYDIEVPDSQNVIANNMVCHNSRWFRYLYKTNV